MTPKQKNKKTALTMLALVVGMFCMAYAAFPLYNLFCKVTGYGGTTQVAESLDTKVGSKILTVRFNADIDPKLPWRFHPLQKQIKIKTGENKMAFYESENISGEDITGMATYNVTPDEAGIYFNKIHCFCFDEQTLEAGQKVEMPVSFYIDPEIESDPDLKDIDTITLSYTFFKAAK